MGGTILANNTARRLSPELRSGKVKITMVTASERHRVPARAPLPRVRPHDARRAVQGPGDAARTCSSSIRLKSFCSTRIASRRRAGRPSTTTFSRSRPGQHPVPNSFRASLRTRRRSTPKRRRSRCSARCRRSKVDASSMRWASRTSVRWRRSRSPSCCTITSRIVAFATKVQLHYTYPIGCVHTLENVAKWAAPSSTGWASPTKHCLTSRRSTERRRSSRARRAARRPTTC